jgi:membrane protein insertase Oxa1/YidC/SpoIIIJ
MMQPTIKKLLLYVFPTITTGLMLALPGALQLSFSVTSMMALLQSHLLRQPWVRQFLRIQPLPQPPNPPSDSVYKGTITIQAPSQSIVEPPPPPKGIIDGALVDIKGAASQIMKTARSMRQSEDTKKGTQRLTKAELKRAHSYEAQKQREIAEEKLEAKTRGSRNANANQRKKKPARSDGDTG